VDFQNIDGLIGTIIAGGKASLHELRTIYTLEDGFLLYESIVIPRYNEWLAAQDADKRKAR
jgi:hypothetical protein